jgi:two-component sensor histidine kinase
MTLEELYRLLRGSHVQAQGIVDTLQEPLVVLDKDLVVVNANPAFLRTFRVERDQTLGRTLFDLGNGQWDIAELKRLLAEVVPKSAAIVGYQVEHSFPDLGQRTMRVSARQLVHPDDNSTQMLVVFDDVTDQLKADAAKDILLAETKHRMKNLMAMVRSVANQTKSEGITADEYRRNFMGRFEAVMSAQDFLTSHGNNADLRALIDQSVKPLAGERAVLADSAPLRLSEHLVMPVSLALHELATNAMKYGALSTDTGTINIEWRTEPRDRVTHLVVNWREQGGPPVSEPLHQGFGTRLISYNCKAEGGDAHFIFDPAGLRVELRLPMH